MGLATEIEAQSLILVEAKKFKTKGVRALRRELRNTNLRKTGDLIKATKGKVKILYGDVDRISFTSLRYGFIQNAGIASPYQIHSGQLMPAQAPKNWIGNALDNEVSVFADFVASTQADAVVKTIKFNSK